ncbi:MAG: tetratricopeptide repeat protein [Deltaproteobacteria bacterium]|nr:tetratricopeptide repeat protein [Deltaproteobacteria bacterium]
MGDGENKSGGSQDDGGSAEPQSPGAEARRHPWYADGSPKAVYALIQRYREEASDGREPLVRARLLHEIGRLFEEHLGDAKQAQAHYQEALSAVPSFVPALRAMRRQHLARHAHAQALELLDRELAATTAPKALSALRRERALLLGVHLGRGGDARADLAEARRLDPQDPLALNAAATAARRGDDAEALREALVELERRATDPEPRRSIRLELARLDETVRERPADAEVWYASMVQADPADADAREGLQRMYRRTGRWQELLAALTEDAARLEGEARADLLYEIARISIDHLDDPARARLALEEIRTIQPDRPMALRELLALYEAAASWEEAVITARALASLSSDPRERLLLLHRLGLMLHEQLGRPDDAVLALRVALTLDPLSSPVLQSLGEILVRHQRWADLCAMHLAEAEAQEDSERKAVALCRAAEVCERQLQKPEDAVAHFEAALAARPFFPPALRGLELLYRRTGKSRDLAGLFGRLADNATEPSQKIGYLERRATTLENVVGDVEGAVVAFEAILELEPEHASARAALTRIHEQRRDWEQLIVQLKRLAERDTSEENAAALLLRAGEIAERELGDPARALAEYEAALALRPNLLAALQAAGRVLHREGRWEDLVGLYRRELDLIDSPTVRATTLCRVGGILEEKLDDAERARQAYHDAFLADPACAPALQALLRMHHETRNLEGVIEVLEAEAAASKDPKRKAVVLARIGEIWEDPLGKVDLALDAYSQALDLDPRLSTARAARSRLLAARGAWEQVVELRLARLGDLKGDDESFRAWSELGWLWSEKVGNLQRAAEGFRRALDLRPGAVGPLRALAWIHAATSQWEALAEVQDKLAETLPADAVRLGVLRDRMVEADRAGLPAALRLRLLEELRSGAPHDPELALLGETLALETTDVPKLVELLQADLADADAPPDQQPTTENQEQRAAQAARYVRLADWLARAGRLTEAADRARQAAELDPSSLPAVSLWTSLVEATHGRIGAEHLRRLAEASGDGATRCVHLVHAAEETAAEESGESWRRAAGMLGEALRSCPASVEAMGLLVRLCGERQAWGELAEQLRSVADDLGDRVEAVEVLYMLSTLQRDRLDDRAGAVSTLNRVLRLSPNHAPALTDLGDLYAEEDQYNEAVTIYRHLMRVDEDETTAAPAAVHLSVLLEDKMQDTASAREVLEQARERFPQAPSILERLVVHLRREARWREAREILEALIARDDLASSRVGYRLQLADLVLEGYDDEAEAVGVLKAAAEEESGSMRAVARLMRLWSERGRWTEIAELLDQRIAAAGTGLGKSHAPLLLELAKVRGTHLRDPAGAIAAQEKAVELDRENRAARLRLAELHAQAGNTRQAIALARGVLADDPLERKAYRILFDVREVAGRVGASAAQALQCLGDADQPVQTMLSRRRPRAVAELSGLTLPVPMLKTLLPPAATHPAADLLALVAPAIGVLFATDLEVHGATKRDRLGGGRSPAGGGLGAAIEAVSRAVGLEDVPAYMAAVDPAKGAFAEPEARPVLVLPRELADAPVGEQIFQLGRTLGKIALGLHLVDKLAAGELATLVAALVRLSVGVRGSSLAVSGAPEERVAELTQRLDRDLPRRIRRTLDPLAAACVERPLEKPEGLLVGVERGADRIGLVLSDALDVAVRFAARREASEAAAAPDLREALRLSASARDLLRFSVSEEREAVGL